MKASPTRAAAAAAGAPAPALKAKRSLLPAAEDALEDGHVVKERQENRKQAGAAMRAIKAIVDAKGPTAGAVEQAAKLKSLEAAFIKMFPPGSDKDSKALPVVWTDWAGFQAASKASDAAYDKLAVAAGSGDQAALAAAFADTGKTCGACHDKFRVKAN